jgi:hypothetical protein
MHRSQATHRSRGSSLAIFPEWHAGRRSGKTHGPVTAAGPAALEGRRKSPGRGPGYRWRGGRARGRYLPVWSRTPMSPASRSRPAPLPPPAAAATTRSARHRCLPAPRQCAACRDDNRCPAPPPSGFRRQWGRSVSSCARRRAGPALQRQPGERRCPLVADTVPGPLAARPSSPVTSWTGRWRLLVASAGTACLSPGTAHPAGGAWPSSLLSDDTPAACSLYAGGVCATWRVMRDPGPDSWPVRR